MVRSVSRAFTGALTAGMTLLALAHPSLARPMWPTEDRTTPPLVGNVPACDQDGVISKISSRFSEREDAYWKSGLEFVNVDKVKETGFRTNGVDYIPRRYCTARVTLNDSKERELVYWIGEDLGMTGYFTWGVEWCVVGLDRNYAAGLNCRAVRP